MASNLKVNNILPTSGGGTVNLGASGDTITVPSGASLSLPNNTVTSASMFSGFKNGITMADQWRLTADTSGGTNADITANLERVDDATFSKIGTGMTESSGIFTFPSTGLYEVTLNPMIRSNTDQNSNVFINVSSDSGSNYDAVAYVNGGCTTDEITASVGQSTFVNVTNASTFRVKFTTSSMGASSFLNGNTDANYTTFKFIRLGDSQ